MKKGVFCILVISLCLKTALLFADEQTSRIYPLPLAEAERIIVQWLSDSGFEVSRTSPEHGVVRVKAINGEQSWLVILKPYSALASSFEAQYMVNGIAYIPGIEELWHYLDGYARDGGSGNNALRDISAAVLARGDSVVCIRATIKNKPVQFSGFLIDSRGSIISTAHDLKGVREMRVFLPDGRQTRGRLVRIDEYRDLSLIKIDEEVKSFIQLDRARQLLEFGEKVYTIGCPLNQQGKINAGIVQGPLRRLNKLPLWQVAVETLPGSSGSPVFDAEGHFVGVVKGRYRGKGSVGFIIPTGTVTAFKKKG